MARTRTYYLKTMTYPGGQNPTKVITVCDTPPYGHASTYQTSLTYLERNIYLTFRSKVKFPRRLLWYVTHRLMVMNPQGKYNQSIWKDKKVMVRTSFAEKKQICRLNGYTGCIWHIVHSVFPYKILFISNECVLYV